MNTQTFKVVRQGLLATASISDMQCARSALTSQLLETEAKLAHQRHGCVPQLSQAERDLSALKGRIRYLSDRIEKLQGVTYA